MLEEICVTLSRLNCNGCVRNVTKALETLPGVEILDVDIPTKTICLRYASDRTTLEAIKTTLAEARYPAIKAEHVLL
jgi:copper chaperone CopZ